MDRPHVPCQTAFLSEAFGADVTLKGLLAVVDGHDVRFKSASLGGRVSAQRTLKRALLGMGAHVHRQLAFLSEAFEADVTLKGLLAVVDGHDVPFKSA